MLGYQEQIPFPCLNDNTFSRERRLSYSWELPQQPTDVCSHDILFVKLFSFVKQAQACTVISASLYLIEFSKTISRSKAPRSTAR